MLRILLDENISPVIAVKLTAKQRGIDVYAIQYWENGTYVASHDEKILAAAHLQGLTLVTYDCASISPILKDWGEQGLDHSGVVFVDHRTIKSSNFGALVAALEQLWLLERKADWTNRIFFLQRTVQSNPIGP